MIIEPLDHGSNQLTVKVRQDLKELIGDLEMKIVSDKNVSLLARQLALHINVSDIEKFLAQRIILFTQVLITFYRIKLRFTVSFGHSKPTIEGRRNLRVELVGKTS